MFLDNVFCDKANTTLPTCRGVVEDVKYFETLLVDIDEFLEVIPQQDVFLIYISIDQGNCGTIGRVLEDSTYDLNHGRNAGTARNQAKVINEVWCIEKIAFWSLDTKSVTYLKVSDVARDIAFFVSLKNDGSKSGKKARGVTRRIALIISENWPRSSSLLIGV